MSSNGFYLMHRGWMDNPVFSNEPFCERMAWAWMIEEASFEPHKIRYHSKMIEVARGQIPTSYRKLKDTFQWGNERVRRFIKLLESEKMISINSGTGFIIITICNYDEYQKPLKKTGTHPGTEAGTESGTHPGTNINKGNEYNEDNTTDTTKRAREIYSGLEVILQPVTILPFAPVLSWIEWGADCELDIKPAAERWRQRNPKRGIGSLTWLDEDIARNMAQRKREKPIIEENHGANANVRRYENQPSKAERAFNAIQLGLSQPTASTGGKP